ncbi:hypothetical protein BCR43DRAFT_526311 [Syncephalastrum racemosum]|uniref:GDSL lipase/esterase n=1 Tax=Syncephalastrum racemosum TaxID=13706 RepID=A0A1X2H603_SYNRA|nr:hypothetical protein BCR43DRAFT_526311 [Syncephalastrum racemosum]
MKSLALTASVLLWPLIQAAPAAESPSSTNPKSGWCWNSVDTVFAFGDSYTNVAGKYGDIWTWNYFTKNSSSLDNPITANLTAASGPVWVQYLTGCYQGLPQKCPQKLWDLAFGGATVDQDLVKPARDFVQDLEHQVQQWQTYIKPAVTFDAEKTLSAVWMGINDITNSENKVKNETLAILQQTALYNKILDAYFEQVDVLYQSEGMRAFLLINVPPLDRTPSKKGDADYYKKAVALFNLLLHARTTEYKVKRSDATIIEFDAHARFEYYLAHASEYGFKNTDSLCEANSTCLPRYEYFWNIGVHPTYVVHKLLAEDIRSELERQSNC